MSQIQISPSERSIRPAIHMCSSCSHCLFMVCTSMHFWYLLSNRTGIKTKSELLELLGHTYKDSLNSQIILDFAKHVSRSDSPFLNVLIFLCSVCGVREKGQSWIRHIPPSIWLLHSPPSGETNAASNKLKEYFVSSFTLPSARIEAVLGFASPQQRQLWSTNPPSSSHTQH